MNKSNTKINATNKQPQAMGWHLSQPAIDQP